MPGGNRVAVTKLLVREMELKNNAIEVQVRDASGRHRGYLEINRAFIRWYRGKSQNPTYEVHLNDFIAEAEREE